MKTLQSTQEKQASTQVSQDSQSDQQNNHTAEAPAADSGSVSASSNDSRKVSRQDIELVQNLIERCLQLYMNRDEVVKTLLTRARIDPGFTTLVWQKLEEENADFFRAYYIRLKLKKQILLFNHLLEHQYHFMKFPGPPKVPLAPIQNGIHPMPVNNLPMGYPVLQQPPMPAPGQPHLDSMGCGISSCHVVNGVPAPANFHPIRMNSGNSMVLENSTADMAPVVPPNSGMSSMSEMPLSPASVASSGHFPFTASDMSGMGVDTSALDTAFTSDVASSVGLQLGPDGGAGTSRSLDQIQWNFSLSDLTADLSNLGDLGALGNYPGSPFLPSDSEILLDSPEHEDIVEEFFVDSVPGPPCFDIVIIGLFKVLENSNLILQVKTSFLEIPLPIAAAINNSIRSDKELAGPAFDHQILEAKLIPVVGCKELDVVSPDDSLNHQPAEDSFMVEGTNGAASQVQSWQLIDDDFSNCVYD